MSERGSGRAAAVVRDGILEELCAAKQRVLLATPYFAVEARILERRGDQLALRIPMSGEAIRHAVGSHPLRIRFPWDLTMYAGPTDIRGFEQEESRRTLLVSIPEAFAMDELRGAWRTDQVGRSRGALGDGTGGIVRVGLENLSASGAGLYCVDPIAADTHYAGRQFTLELSLDKGPTFSTKGRIAHGEGHSLGVAFAADSAVEELLRGWLAPRKKEAQRAWDNRLATRAAAEAALKPKAAPRGVLLVTSDAALAEQVARLMEEDCPVRTSAPALGPLKKHLETPPQLVLLDITGAGLDARHRLRTMVEGLALACPVVVMGQGVPSETLRGFSADLKAVWSYEWNPNQGPFFQRLVKGVIRRHSREEGPPTP